MKALWAEHWRALLLAFGVLVGQAVLIGALLLSRRRRVAAAAGLREAEQRYHTVAAFTHDWEYWSRPDESFAYVSPSCLRVTGYTAEEFYRRPTLLNEIVAPEDRPRWTEHSRLAPSQTQAAPPLEIRIVRADGEVRFRRIVESADDIIYRTDAEGRFDYVNPAAEEAFSLSEAELLGRSFHDVVRPDYREQARLLYEDQRLQELPTTYCEFPLAGAA